MDDKEALHTLFGSLIAAGVGMLLVLLYLLLY